MLSLKISILPFLPFAFKPIQNSMLDVRCSMFNRFLAPGYWVDTMGQARILYSPTLQVKISLPGQQKDLPENTFCRVHIPPRKPPKDWKR